MEVDNETTREPPRFQMPIDRSTDGGAFAHWRHPASVWIAVDLAVIGLRAQALRAERAVGTGCGLCGIVGADLWAGRQCVGRLGAVLQGLAVGAPVAVVGLVIDKGVLRQSRRLRAILVLRGLGRQIVALVLGDRLHEVRTPRGIGGEIGLIARREQRHAALGAFAQWRDSALSAPSPPQSTWLSERTPLGGRGGRKETAQGRMHPWRIGFGQHVELARAFPLRRDLSDRMQRAGEGLGVAMGACARTRQTIRVVFRSAKERPFAERKATLIV